MNEILMRSLSFLFCRCETYSQAELPEESLHQRSNCSGNDASSTSSKAELLLSALIARGSKVNPLKRKWVTSAAATSAEGASKKLVSSAATKATELAERFTRLDISHHEDNNVAQPPLPPPLPPPPRPNAPLAIPQLRTQWVHFFFCQVPFSSSLHLNFSRLFLFYMRNVAIWMLAITLEKLFVSKFFLSFHFPCLDVGVQIPVPKKQKASLP